MPSRQRLYRVVLLALCLALVGPLLAEQPAGKAQTPVKKSTPTQFLRLQRDADKTPASLDTAIVRYVPANGEAGVTVDLVAAVHIGDKAYYQKLNKQFEQYDVLLYELVAPPGTRVPKGGKKEIDDPLALLQQGMKLMLGLDSQLEQVDYTKKNFVHADLSPEQMAEAMKKRGEDGLTLTLGIIADMLREKNVRDAHAEKKPQKEEEDIDPIGLLLDPEGGLKMKRMMAEQMADQITGTGGIGKTLSTILVDDRNKAALKVFQTEMAKGKKKIGIFYGAAHMPDFEKRLRDDFGLKRDSEQWLTAWDLKKQAKGNPIEDILKLLK